MLCLVKQIVSKHAAGIVRDPVEDHSYAHYALFLHVEGE